MTRCAAMFFIGVLAYFACAHFIYLFIMLEWSPFTEWQPLSRGLNLLAGAQVGVCAAFLAISHD